MRASKAKSNSVMDQTSRLLGKVRSRSSEKQGREEHSKISTTSQVLNTIS
uniref:Uncharacterized protein n=1 Tax=Brassica oleracea var. oleracea TaxID=109376 RepID=A0A0D3DSV9_BRAOL